MPLDCALQCLVQESYYLFLLTIGSNTVVIYSIPNGSLKIFDSHARDLLGMPHPHGTCVLLEVNSINSLTEYFRNAYKPNVLFELKGIKITVAQITNQHTNDSDTNMCPSTSNKFNSGKCCAICYYSICFSTISACSYWNDQILSAIIEHANLHYQEGLNDSKEFTCDYLPQIIDICGADVEVVFNSRYQGEFFFTSVYCKHLGRLILENATENTGFLLCFSNFYFSCIFQHNTRQTKYFLVACK